MNSKCFSCLVLILVLFSAVLLRIPTFYLPHNHGDRIFYLGLAMKLEQAGLKNYNLKGIDIISGKHRYNAVVIPSPAPVCCSWGGTFLKKLDKIK